jgi:lysozyme
MHTNNADTSKYLKGMDVSEYEPTIDWAKVAQSDIKFCFLRASHGLHLDTSFSQHRAGAKSVGLPRGFYHYFVPTISVAEQVSAFLQVVQQIEPGDLSPVLDIEDPPAWAKIKRSERLQLILDWLSAIEKALGVRPMIYCSVNFVQKTLADPAVDLTPLSRYRLWIAQWHVTGNQPDVPSPWDTWTFWQYTDKGTVNGVDADAVDLDVFNGSVFDLINLAKK